MVRLDHTDDRLRRVWSTSSSTQEAGQLVEARRRMGHGQGAHDCSLFIEDDHLMVVVRPIDAGKPQRACSLSTAL